MADLSTAEANARLALEQGPQTCVAMTAAEAVELFERLRAAEMEAVRLGAVVDDRNRALDACATRIAGLMAEMKTLRRHRDAYAADADRWHCLADVLAQSLIRRCEREQVETR